MSQNIVNFPGASLRAEDARFTTFYANNVSMHASSGLEQITAVGHVTTTGIEISNIKPSTSSTTGALVVAGGVGVAGNVTVGSNLSVSGATTVANLSVTGETVEVANLAVTSGSLELTQVSNIFQIKSSSNVVTEFKRSKKLIKYPREALASSSQNGYILTSSSELNSSYQRHEAFNNVLEIGDGNTLEGWISGGSPTYDSSDPYTASSTDTFSGAPSGHQNGAWLGIQLPEKIKLSGIKVYQRHGSSGQEYNKDTVIYASNDGSTWYNILGFDSSSSEIFEIDVNATTYYDRYVFHVTSVNHSYGYACIEELELYGIPEYDPEAHGTDTIVRSVPNVPNTDWLEVYYDGQDYSSMPSTVTDKSGNGRTGTPNNGVTFDSTWEAFTFDGVNDYIRGTISSVTGDYIHSASLWIKLADMDDCIFEISGATRAANSVIGLYVDADGTLAYYFYDNDARYNTNLQIDQWYHVGLTYHGGGKRHVYVNGVQATFKTSYGTLTNSLTLAGGTLTIGNDVDLSANYFNGSMANFRLFNRALSADEVWQLYAYQKDYFQVSPDVLTFKGGRLGIGTEEPRAVLDVRGSFYAPGSVVQVVTNPHWGQATYTSSGGAEVKLAVLQTSITPKFSNSKMVVQVYMSYEADYNSVIFVRANGRDIPYGRGYGDKEGTIPTAYDGNVASTPNSSAFVVHHDVHSTGLVTYDVIYKMNGTSTGTIHINEGYSATDEHGICYVVVWEIAQ